MIVRDEEAVLGRCLASVQGLVDEVIVVDTGSTDGTVHIARGFGAVVYTHPWADDFSRHRNQAVGYAGGDWILIMDADEVIARQDIEKIRELVREPKADGYRFILRNYENNPALANLILNPGDYEEERGFLGFIPVRLIRLFRNRKQIFFAGTVHETVDESFRKLGLSFADTHIPIHHYGKVMNDCPSRKAEIYLNLGEEKLRQQPDNPSAYKGLTDQYLESGMPHKALDVLAEGIARFPELIELRFNRGLALDRLDRPREAQHDYEWVLGRMPGHPGACHNLGRIYLDENKAGQAIQLLSRGVEKGVRHPAVFFLLGRAFSAARRWKEALDTFDRVLEIQSDYPDVHLRRAVVFLNTQQYDDALHALEKEIEAGANPAAAYNLLGEMCLTFNDPQSATPFFRKVLTIKPDDPTAKKHLEQISRHENPTLKSS
jgi:tetratricopeptide (TPR) repeat protein